MFKQHVNLVDISPLEANYGKFISMKSITIMDYFRLSALEQRVYDNKVQDELVAALIIKGCKYNSLWEWLKNQQLAPGIECAYPKTSSGAVELIDNGNWGKETTDGKRRGHNNSRKQESSGEDIIGSHVHDND